jgi:hypothetical protein
VGRRTLAPAGLIAPGATGEKAQLDAHTTAAEIIGRLTPDFWRGAFKFTAERHPYEKAVSFAHFRWQKRTKVEARRGERFAADFDAHLDQVVREGGYEGFPYYTIDGRPVVDDFIRYETLDADLRRIGARLGVPIPPELPQKKKGYRTDPRPAREILNAEQRDAVFARCRPEFELLGYER